MIFYFWLANLGLLHYRFPSCWFLLQKTYCHLGYPLFSRKYYYKLSGLIPYLLHNRSLSSFCLNLSAHTQIDSNYNLTCISIDVPSIHQNIGSDLIITFLLVSILLISRTTVSFLIWQISIMWPEWVIIVERFFLSFAIDEMSSRTIHLNA